MIKLPPCDLPMEQLVPMVPLQTKNVQGFLVTIGKNGINGTIDRFADFAIGKTPNVATDLFNSVPRSPMHVFYQCFQYFLPYLFSRSNLLEVLV